jgi:hypothetical protein
MSYSAYYDTNLPNDANLPNFAKNPNIFPDNGAQIKGVGCAGVNSGVIATESNFVEPGYVPQAGGNVYGFTNIPIAPVAGPGAPYSEIRGYNDRGVYRDLFPKLFKGGKKIQYGCNKAHKHSKARCNTKRVGGKKSKKISRNKHSKKSRKHKKTKSKRGGHYATMSRRGGSKKMRGGMNSLSDYTEGRDASQDQPYSNKAISFGQTFDTSLNADESGMASPTPLLPTNSCGKFIRN